MGTVRGWAMVAGLALLASQLGAPTQAQTAPRAAAQTAGKTWQVIGTSVKGRKIWATRIGDPTASRRFVALAVMHGDEEAPARILRNLREGPRVKGVDLWVVPVLNPDGYVRHTRKNARGVDLNRNFPHRWVRQGGKYYSGRGPASEPETRALMRFLDRVNPQGVVSFHQPLHGVGRSHLGRAGPFERRLASELRLPRESFNCNGVCRGTMTEWFNARHHGVAITVEYGHSLSEAGVRRAASGLLRAIGGRR